MTENELITLEAEALARAETSERIGDKVRAHELAMKRAGHKTDVEAVVYTVMVTCIPWCVGWFVWGMMR